MRISVIFFLLSLLAVLLLEKCKLLSIFAVYSLRKGNANLVFIVREVIEMKISSALASAVAEWVFHRRTLRTVHNQTDHGLRLTWSTNVKMICLSWRKCSSPLSCVRPTPANGTVTFSGAEAWRLDSGFVKSNRTGLSGCFFQLWIACAEPQASVTRLSDLKRRRNCLTIRWSPYFCRRHWKTAFGVVIYGLLGGMAHKGSRFGEFRVMSLETLKDLSEGWVLKAFKTFDQWVKL